MADFITNLLNFFGKRSTLWLVLCAVSGIGLAAVEVLFSVVVVMALQKVGVLSGGSGGRVFEILNTFSVQMILIGLIMLGFLKSAMHIFSGISAVAANEIFSAHLKILSIKNLLSPSSRYADSSLVGSLFAESFPKVSVFFLSSAHLISLSIQTLLIGICLCISSVPYTIVGVVYLCIVGIFVFFLHRAVQKLVAPMPIVSEKLIKGIFRVIKNWFLIRVFKLEDIEMSKNANLVVWSATKTNYSNLLSLIGVNLPNAFGVVLVVIFILVHQRYQLMPGQLFVSYLYLFMRFVQALSQMTHFGGVVTINMPHFKRVYSYYEDLTNKGDQELNELCGDIKIFSNSDSLPAMVTHVHSSENGRELRTLLEPPEINIKNLSFKYSSEAPLIVDNLNLHILGGEQLAIVGPSGAGKSTLLALLLGLLEPSAGDILIGGVRPEYFFKEKSRLVGYAGPDPFLIEGSIRDNLLYGNLEYVAEEAIFFVLESIGLKEFIMSVPNGLDFKIDEEGSMLSTGQKQRLAIARSLLREPKILILDEVSANLDEANERLLAEKIRDLRGATTVLIVSHRPGMISYADTVVNFEKIERSTLVNKHV